MPQKWSLADCQHGGKTAKLPVNLPAASATRAVKWAESFILGHHPVCRWLRPATKPRNLRSSFYIVVTVRWETLRIEHSNNKRRSTMSIMNHLHALRTAGRSIQSKPGLLERFARAGRQTSVFMYWRPLTQKQDALISLLSAKSRS
jgi:hypothetical protein